MCRCWTTGVSPFFFSPGQVMIGAHLGLHLASVVAWRFHQHQVPSFSKDPFKSSHGWSGWSTICDLMLDRNSIVHSNGSRLFSAGRPLGTRKNSVHCLWFLCCCTQTLHRTPFETFSYFTHVDVCFGFLITALLCKLRVDINHQSADLENGWLAHVTSRVVQPGYRTQYLHNF